MNSKRLSLLALFIALSAIGSAIKIPVVISSVALDAFPALLAAVLISKRSGALVAGLGHVVSALLGGMPLGPLHILVAAEMALIVWRFGYIYQSGQRIFASVFFVIANGLLASVPFIFLMSLSFYLAITPGLLIGALVNTILALLLEPRVASIFHSRMEGT
ncbi:ECF transporter S component [Virgibacillus soli]|uniref:ECF transporter S component n=1 Tax=Paracerasibacillus soli TaxID=480284 RepID=A0ABU5CP86_9BACI|nr:ECF transporter S component [Virgibacillus soli]MDY0407696.1 ECF transporter S component [Virgibacillus soli]